MSAAPVLETPRLRLVPFGPGHLTDRYVSWLNDPEVVRYSEQRHRRHTRESCGEFLRSFDAGPHLFWAVEAHAEGLGHIGNLTAYLDAPNGTADVGILIGAKEAWGRGYGSEAWIAACGHLLGTRGLRKVTAGTLSLNAGMLAVMRKAGMSEEGRRRRQNLCEGQEADMVLSALFREDWLLRRSGGRP